MPHDPFGIQIGAREIYDKLVAVEQTGLETRSDVRGLVEKHDGLRTDIDAVDGRVRVVELTYVTRTDLDKKSLKTIQIIGIIAAICGSAAGVLTAIIIAITQ